MNTIKYTTRWLGLALACSIITFTAATHAVKPSKPPPSVDTGIIYAQIEGDIYALSPDGSGQEYLFTPPGGVDEVHVVPSELTHNGQRWFVGWQRVEGTYPDGVSGRYRLMAMSESGAIVVLHDDVMLQPSLGSSSSLRWMPGDSAVSWLAMRWEGDTVVEWGLYTLDIEFTADGSVAAGLPALLDWTSELFEIWYEPPGTPWLAGYYLFVDSYDWSPDGSAIVYSAYPEEGGSQLYVADDAGGVVQLTTDVDTYPVRPRWSPEGTRILFQLNSSHQIDVIDLATAQRHTLVATPLDDYYKRVWLPAWSPGSTHVVYGYYTWHLRKGGRDALHVIAADGSGDATLTDTYTYVYPLGWCPGE